MGKLLHMQNVAATSIQYKQETMLQNQVILDVCVCVKACYVKIHSQSQSLSNNKNLLLNYTNNSLSYTYLKLIYVFVAATIHSDGRIT